MHCSRPAVRASGAALLLLGLLTGATSCLPAQGGPATPPPLPEDAEWKTTASGLRYTVIEPGEGEPVAEPGDTVAAHYTGWLEDGGTKFDSSRDRGAPFSFTVGQGVIRGWSEGVQLMPVGATFRFEIPSDLAYGDQGRPPRIPAKATLLFDIELVSHKKARKPHAFVEADPDAQVEVEPGLTYQVLREGEGETCGPSDNFLMHLSLYQADGTLLQSTLVDGQPLPGNPEKMGFPVLQKMPTRMKPGTMVRASADKSQGLGERSPPGVDETVWILEMLHVQKDLEVPEFTKPPEEELESSDTGLQWKVIREGEGAPPETTDTVIAHYAGRLLETGEVFDSSYGRGLPTPFPLNRVIPGWTEGVSMMKPGEIRLLVIPSKLGYGERGSPPDIPGGADLMFWIELISVER